MMIWVDGDGFPRQLRDIIIRTAERTGIPAAFAADRKLPLQASDDGGGTENDQLIRQYVVDQGDDEADSFIARHVEAGDVVCTRDIFFMERCVEKGAVCFDDRGHLYDADTIRERVSVRKLMGEYRDYAGDSVPGGGNRFSAKEVKAFADVFSRFIDRRVREEKLQLE